MKKHNKKLYTGIFIVIFFTIFIIFSSTWTSDVQVAKMDLPATATTPTILNTKPVIPSAETKTPTPKTEIIPSPIDQKIESVTISAGDTTIKLQSGIIFYDALTQAKNAGTIMFSGENYPGLGFFVTDIGTLHMGNGKNLLYYVNGKQASVGVSFYMLKDGDIIEWKLE